MLDFFYRLTFSSALLLSLSCFGAGLPIQAPEFKTIKWLRARIAVSSFRRWSKEYQEFSGDLVVKINLSPRGGSEALRQANHTHKKEP